MISYVIAIYQSLISNLLMRAHVNNEYCKANNVSSPRKPPPAVSIASWTPQKLATSSKIRYYVVSMDSLPADYKVLNESNRQSSLELEN
ncbi:hypothetical protein BKA56DRAFT_667758 [Ilyonectria sp. MPI-CAGE-AT-0026]|nr:hypothetical protein BKA56DRAFT_667758 [Ilyonectria sp. MPI-CAGE-AT-0026]